MACNGKRVFFTSHLPKRFHFWSCQKICDVLHYLYDNICIRFGSKLYRQFEGIPKGTNCAPLAADLFLFCYERDFLMSVSDNYQGLSIQRVKNLYHMFNNCCMPVCIDHTFNDCWFLVYKWSVMEKQIYVCNM